MNKEFVPHEQSLELRKLKFDEPCLGFYVGKDKEVFMSSNDFNAPFQFRLDSKTTFVAPTFSQAFRFFNEKYGLYHYNIRRDYYISEDGVRSYDDIELECLKKLIEIVNAKQVPVEPTGVTTQPYDESPHTKTFRTPASDFNSRGQYRK